jgi:hypothetical protein
MKTQKLKPLPLCYKNAPSSDLPSGKINYLFANPLQEVKRQLCELRPTDALEFQRYLANIQSVAMDAKSISQLLNKSTEQSAQMCFENLCYLNYLVNEIAISFTKFGSEYEVSPVTPFDILKQVLSIQNTLTKFNKLRDCANSSDLIKTLIEIFPSKEPILLPDKNKLILTPLSPTKVEAPIIIPKTLKIISKPTTKSYCKCKAKSLKIYSVRRMYDSCFNDFELRKYDIINISPVDLQGKKHNKYYFTLNAKKPNLCTSYLQHIEVSKEEKEEKPLKLFQGPVMEENDGEIENKNYEIKTLKYEIYTLQSIIEALKLQPDTEGITIENDTIESVLRAQMASMKKGYEELKQSLIDKIKKLNADYIHNIKASEREIKRLKDMIAYK